MAHHKRGKKRGSRSGCLFCKPHKGNGSKGRFCFQTWQEKRSRVSAREQLLEKVSVDEGSG